MEQYEIDHIARLRKIVPECMVLLKTDGSFPVEKPGRIALYGNGARRTLKGGRGSADVYVRSYTTVEQGLEKAGFEVTTKYWLDAYEEARKKANASFRAWLKEKIAAEGLPMLMENLSIVMPEPEYDIPLTGEGDTAVYVLARLCGEGVDRQDVPGDFRLSNTEIRDILWLQTHYKKFMLVLNTACIVDLSPIAQQVDNILLLSQLGSTIGDSLADVLLGKEYPSGKLAATWACREAYSYIQEFGNRDDTRYLEGIYVGYRYFDTAGVQPVFPFGHGLGYTTFDVKSDAPNLEGTRLSVPVRVTNIGKCRGREVVQLYVSVPSGKLAQPFQTLAAFAKTGELLPGQTETILLSCAMESLASTNDADHVRVLEKGKYILRVGVSSANTKVIGAVVLDETAVTEHIHCVGGETDFEDLRLEAPQLQIPDHVPCLSLKAADVPCAEHMQAKPSPEALAFAQSLCDEDLCYLCTGDFVGEGSKSVIGDSAITVVGAAGETTARFRDRGIRNVIFADGPSGVRITRQYGVDEAGVYRIEEENSLMEIENKTELLPEPILKALSAMMLLEKQEPRSGRIFEQNCTAIPAGTALAQTWNPAAVEACTEIVAEEMKHFGIDVLLAPALNIQRHPLCGRNFEYMSEDPLVSGKIAAGYVRGIQKNPGLAVTLKHFICNNQEANRFRTSSMVNGRSLRDLYARGFEIAIKEAQPHCLMSSYNLLNGVHTSERYDLLETLLRQEWGYQGMVMSDYLGGEKETPKNGNRYRKFHSAESVKAGNDLMMPGGKEHYENILHALRGEDAQCSLTRQEVEKCAARNIELVWKLGKR